MVVQGNLAPDLCRAGPKAFIAVVPPWALDTKDADQLVECKIAAGLVRNLH